MPVPATLPGVAILDADERSALAATRALGARGIRVVTAGERALTLAGASRYAAAHFTYPSPEERPEAFIETLRQELRRHDVGVLLPMTEVTTQLVIEHGPTLDGVRVPFPGREAFEQLTDKASLVDLAQRVGVRVPRTSLVARPEDLDVGDPKLRFPLVLKPRRSRFWNRGRVVRTHVCYARSREELERTLAEQGEMLRGGFLVQEYVEGEGRGVFAFYRHGEPVAFFAHRRLRERPPSGGVSVLSESTELSPELRRPARALLDAASWHGVAMVEFKVSPEGVAYLMEVNARFWGSLQLAIDAGVDFPYLAYALAAGLEVEGPRSYRVGVRCRWLLGDLDTLYLSLFKNGPGSARTMAQKARVVREFCRFFDRDTRYEVNRYGDLRPFLVELKSYFLGRQP